MEGLGRVFNIIPIAASRAINMRDAEAVTFIGTGADTFTVTSSTAFGGSFTSPGNIFAHYYASTATNGSAAWTRQTQTASNAVTIASGTALLTVNAAALPDAHDYVRCVPSATGLVYAVIHDLKVMRKPANLAIISA